MALFVSYNCITSPAARYMKGTDTAWLQSTGSISKASLRGQNISFAFLSLTKQPAQRRHGGMTPNHRSSLQSQLCLGDTKEVANTTVFSVYSSTRAQLEQLQGCQKYLLQNQLLNTVVRCVQRYAMLQILQHRHSGLMEGGGEETSHNRVERLNVKTYLL